MAADSLLPKIGQLLNFYKMNDVSSLRSEEFSLSLIRSHANTGSRSFFQTKEKSLID